MKKVTQVIEVTDMRSLKLEKARLKGLCREMEEEGQIRLDYIKEHYGTMFFNTVFPSTHPQKHIWKLLGYALKSAWRSDHFRSVLLTALITLLEFLGIHQSVRLFEKYFKKKKPSEEQSSS
jgi:hypothetical protein